MSLEKSAAKGVRWNTFSMLTLTVAQILQLVVLGRILGPEAFGLLAMILVVTGFAELIAQMGLSEAIIQQPSPSYTELSSLYWLNICLGIFMYTVLFLATPLIAALYSTPELKQLLPWVALTFLISPWGAQFKALLQKQLDFRPIAIIEVIAAVAATAIAIALAWAGYGVWSLIWGRLTQNTIMTVLLLILGWQRKMLPGCRFENKAVKPYLAFGLHLLGSNTLDYLNSRTDQLIVGALLGPQALGYYSMAFNLVFQPISKINPILTRVAFPALARVRADKMQLKRGYLLMLKLLTSINAPILAGAAAVAPLLIPIALGESWLPIVPLVQVLALFSLLYSTGNAGGSLVIACGRSDMAFYWNLMLFMFIPPIICIAAWWGGLISVAWGLLGLQIALVFLWYHLVVKQLLSECFSEFINSIALPILFSVPMVMVITAATELLSNSLPATLQLATLIFIGALTYIGTFILIRRGFLKRNFHLFFNRS